MGISNEHQKVLHQMYRGLLGSYNTKRREALVAICNEAGFDVKVPPDGEQQPAAEAKGNTSAQTLSGKVSSASEQEKIPDLTMEQISVFEQLRAVGTEDRVSTVLTGEAGTGKSTIIRALLARDRNRYVVCATTGRAALHVGGCTVDALFSYDRERNTTRNLDRLKTLMARTPNTVIMDEGSMSGKKMSDYVYRICERYGKRIIIVGDWAQCGPVRDEWANESPLLASAKILRLTQIHRQADAAFVSALNDIRRGRVTTDAYSLFSQRFVADNASDTVMRPVATNRAANAYNYERVNALGTPISTLRAKYNDLRRTAAQYPLKPEQMDKVLDESRLAHNVPICVGARIVMTANLYSDEDFVYANGDQGTIVSIAQTTSGVPYEITVRLDRTGDNVRVSPVQQTSVDPLGEPSCTITGFPLLLGWALTIHRMQGMSVDKVHFDMSTLGAMRGESLHGLAYVALSRARTLQGLTISGWDNSYVYCAPQAQKLL